MRHNYAKALEYILEHEGGYVNDPHDRGGATNYGVTQATYDSYLRRKRRASKSVRDITMQEVQATYREQYAAPIRFDDLPDGVDYFVFDFAVNSGVSRSAQFLQRAVGAKVDGHIGLNTLAAVAKHDPSKLIVDLTVARMSFLKRISTWWRFGKGWTRRVEGERLGYQVDDTGVLDRALNLAKQAPPQPTKTKPTNPPTSGFFNVILSAIKALFGGSNGNA